MWGAMGAEPGPQFPPFPRVAMEQVTLLLLVSLFFPCGAQGHPECWEQAVAANGMLELLPGNPMREWARVKWRTGPDRGFYQLILLAQRNKPASVPKGPFSGRAVFQEEPLSLRISPVRAVDAGFYRAEFEDPSGSVLTRCFHVSVWGTSRYYCRVKGLLCLLVLGSLVAAVAITHVLIRQQGSLPCRVPGSSCAG